MFKNYFNFRRCTEIKVYFFLAGEDLEEDMATPTQYFYTENPMDRRPWWLSPRGNLKKLDLTEATF